MCRKDSRNTHISCGNITSNADKAPDAQLIQPARPIILCFEDECPIISCASSNLLKAKKFKCFEVKTGLAGAECYFQWSWFFHLNPHRLTRARFRKFPWAHSRVDAVRVHALPMDKLLARIPLTKRVTPMLVFGARQKLRARVSPNTYMTHAVPLPLAVCWQVLHGRHREFDAVGHDGPGYPRRRRQCGDH